MRRFERASKNQSLLQGKWEKNPEKSEKFPGRTFDDRTVLKGFHTQQHYACDMNA